MTVVDQTRYVPRLSLFKGRYPTLRTAYINFDYYKELLKWLGITKKEDILHRSMKEINKNGATYLHVIGGTQRTESGIYRPLNFVQMGSIYTNFPEQNTTTSAIGSPKVNSDFEQVVQKHCTTSLTLCSTEWINS